MKTTLSFHQSPDHFHVREELFYQPCGSGPHIFVQIEKRDLSTAFAKRHLSAATGVPLKHIRHAGRKDRAATTTQWLSWPAAAEKRPPQDLDGIRILDITRHDNALSLGHVKANHFRLVLTRQGNAVPPSAEKMSQPFPNFYGRQRFGKAVFQLEELRTWIDRDNRDREHISVLQAGLFNAFLRERRQATGDALTPEELWTNTNGKRCFHAPIDADLVERFKRDEVTPTGPIFGYKTRFTDLELAWLDGLGLTTETFRKWGKIARGARRALFIQPAQLQITATEATLTLSFTLPSGAYATVFLTALFLPEALLESEQLWPNFTAPVELIS